MALVNDPKASSPSNSHLLPRFCVASLAQRPDSAFRGEVYISLKPQAHQRILVTSMIFPTSFTNRERQIKRFTIRTKGWRTHCMGEGVGKPAHWYMAGRKANWYFFFF